MLPLVEEEWIAQNPGGRGNFLVGAEAKMKSFGEEGREFSSRGGSTAVAQTEKVTIAGKGGEKGKGGGVFDH